MAGINRLGKAPPKPGTLRPPDPNKYRTVDIFSEGAEKDVEYQRMVNDIEEMQQQQGWLFGRGAFDKADLLYLRDQAEQQRHKEIELRDNERTEYAQLKAQVEQNQDERTTPPALKATMPKGEKRPMKILAQIKVKNPNKPAGPAGKRAKLENHKTEDTATNSESDAAGKGHCSPAELGLLGLLGSYASDAESTDSESAPAKVVSEPSLPKVTLPAASELFGLPGHEVHSSEPAEVALIKAVSSQGLQNSSGESDGDACSEHEANQPPMCRTSNLNDTDDEEQ